MPPITSLKVPPKNPWVKGGCKGDEYSKMPKTLCLIAGFVSSTLRDHNASIGKISHTFPCLSYQFASLRDR